MQNKTRSAENYFVQTKTLQWIKYCNATKLQFKNKKQLFSGRTPRGLRFGHHLPLLNLPETPPANKTKLHMQGVYMRT